MKKIACLLASLILFALCGCQNKDNDNDYISIDLSTPYSFEGTASSSSNQGTDQINYYLSTINDKNGGKIAQMSANAKDIILLDDGYIYNVSGTYYRCYFNDKTPVTIGKVNDFLTQSSGSAVIDDHLYFLAASYLGSFQNGILYVIDLSLVNNTMKVISDDTFSPDEDNYCNSSLAIDRNDGTKTGFYILKQKQDGSDILKYDIEIEKAKETRFSDTLKNLQKSKTVIRAFDCSAGMLNILEQSRKKVFTLLNCPLTLSSNIYDDKAVKADVIIDNTDREMGPSSLSVIGDYVYYKNLRVNITFLGLQNNGKIDMAMSTDSTFMKASESCENGSNAVFFDTAQNAIYYLDADAKSSEKMKKMNFSLRDEGFTIENVYRSSDDHLLVSTVGKTNVKYMREHRYFYIKLSDLDFENVELQD